MIGELGGTDTWVAVSIIAGFGALIFGSLEAGRRLAIRRMLRDPEGAKANVVAIETAVFGLLGLMVAFTFSGASSRFEARRQLVIQETNNIGTAWLRLDLLPPADQPALRDAFRSYVASRLGTYRVLADPGAAREELARTYALQTEIWTMAVRASATSADPRAAMLVLPAVNSMIDITTDRTAALIAHPPAIIYIVVGILALVSSALAGYSMANVRAHSWFHMVGFALVLTAAIYVNIDLEFPRVGFIRIDFMDRLLTDLLESMK